MTKSTKEIKGNSCMFMNKQLQKSAFETKYQIKSTREKEQRKQKSNFGARKK